MIKVTGNLIYRIKKVFINDKGKDEYDKLVETLPENTKETLKDIIVSGDWYDIQVYRDFLDGIIKNYGEEDLVNINIALARQQLGGLFGFFVKFVSAEKVISNCQVMWNKLNSQGKIWVPIFRKEYIKIRISDFDFTEAHLMGTAAYIRGLAEVLMKKTPRYKYKRLGKYEFELDYYFD